MRKATLALAVLGVMLGTGAVSAKGKSLTGIWTMTVEQHFGLRLELAQDKNALTGRLDWPHGDPIKLVGAVKGDTVTVDLHQVTPGSTARPETSPPVDAGTSGAWNTSPQSFCFQAVKSG